MSVKCSHRVYRWLIISSVFLLSASNLKQRRAPTEVLTAEKTFQNNIRAYIYNLKASLKVVGMCLFELVSGQPMYGAIKINCIQGPEEGMLKQEARVILQQMAPLLTEPQDQRKLLLANVEKDNEYVNTLVEILQPMPTAQEMQDQELITRLTRKSSRETSR